MTEYTAYIIEPSRKNYLWYILDYTYSIVFVAHSYDEAIVKYNTMVQKGT